MPAPRVSFRIGCVHLLWPVIKARRERFQIMQVAPQNDHAWLILHGVAIDRTMYGVSCMDAVSFVFLNAAKLAGDHFAHFVIEQAGRIDHFKTQVSTVPIGDERCTP